MTAQTEDSLVEVMARAMAKDQGLVWDDIPESYAPNSRMLFLEYAEAAFAALRARRITHEMNEAGIDALAKGDLRCEDSAAIVARIWTAMLEVAEEGQK